MVFKGSMRYYTGNGFDGASASNIWKIAAGYRLQEIVKQEIPMPNGRNSVLGLAGCRRKK
jgi:hypothetical protein